MSLRRTICHRYAEVGGTLRLNSSIRLLSCSRMTHVSSGEQKSFRGRQQWLPKCQQIEVIIWRKLIVYYLLFQPMMSVFRNNGEDDERRSSRWSPLHHDTLIFSRALASNLHTWICIAYVWPTTRNRRTTTFSTAIRIFSMALKYVSQSINESINKRCLNSRAAPRLIVSGLDDDFLRSQVVRL